MSRRSFSIRFNISDNFVLSLADALSKFCENYSADVSLTSSTIFVTDFTATKGTFNISHVYAIAAASISFTATYCSLQVYRSFSVLSRESLVEQIPTLHPTIVARFGIFND